MVRVQGTNGAIAQLARAPALQAGGPGFESLLLHQKLKLTIASAGEFRPFIVSVQR
jgi:hypothetical protein